MQAEQEIASLGPCPRSPKEKGRAAEGYMIVFGQAKTLIGPRRQRGLGSALEPQL